MLISPESDHAGAGSYCIDNAFDESLLRRARQELDHYHNENLLQVLCAGERRVPMFYLEHSAHVDEEPVSLGQRVALHAVNRERVAQLCAQ